MNLLQQLADHVIERFGEHLVSAPRTAQDALTLEFDNGIALQARFAGDGEYCLAWRFGGVEQRIDTAPVHPELATFPQHLHRADGSVGADPLTQPNRPPQANLDAVIETLLQAPESLT